MVLLLRYSAYAALVGGLILEIGEWQVPLLSRSLVSGGAVILLGLALWRVIKGSSTE